MSDLGARVAVTIAELISAGFCFTMAYWGYKKHQETGSKTTRLCTLFLVSFGLAPLVQPLDLIPSVMESFPYLGYSLAAFFAAFGNFFLLNFCFEVFPSAELASTKRKVILAGFLTLEMVISVAVMLLKFQRINVTLLMAVHMLLSFSVYFYMIYHALNASKRMQEAVFKKGFRYIAYSGISLVVMYSLFILDSFHSMYTYYSALGWAASIAATFYMYLGFFLPSWFRKRVGSIEEKPPVSTPANA